MKIALIYGITGMDGSHLAELLLEKEYVVHGVIRRSSSFNTGRIDHIFKELNLHYGDITDPNSVNSLISEIQPDEIYNLAAQSHVAVSFEIPNYTGQVDAIGTTNILEAVRNLSHHSKFYQASTSELFGKVVETPQKETTPFYPRSPYAVAKLYGYWITKNYREAYDLFVCNGILFNHTGPRRGGTFVEKKIVDGLCKFIEGGRGIRLGNIYSKRDIGFAPEYVEGMWRMLQQDDPDDYILSTGVTTTIKDIVIEVLSILGIEHKWLGEGLNEICVEKGTDKIIVSIDERYFRPTEVDLLLGDNSKAKEKLGWEPTYNLNKILHTMIKMAQE